jgi:selenocysteine-specific elongation factor
LRLGFVDVPGHERFVRNMLAGIGGIDLVMLVIAADEGIKPQTREHFDICRMLAIRRGLTVLTKSDMVDAETLEVVRQEVADFLRGSFLDRSLLDASQAPIVAVSSLTGAGLEQVRRELARVAMETPARDSGAIARLPVDRVFSMRGFGTVVTGTLVSGSINKEEELEVFSSGRLSSVKQVRVRGVQVHGAAAERAVAGQRTALNLAGASREELARGVTLAPPATFRSTKRADVRLSLLSSSKPLKDGARVHFHTYTMETVAEVRLHGSKQLAAGAEGFAQIRLTEAALLLPGDRFILRQFSPVVTIGGGVVLDAFPPTRKRASADTTAFLQTLLKGSAEESLTARVTRSGLAGFSLRQVVGETNVPVSEAEKLSARAGLVRCGSVLITQANFAEAQKKIVDALKSFHDANPLVGGMGKEALRDRAGAGMEVFQAVMDRSVAEKKIEAAGELLRLPGRGVTMKDEEAESKRTIEQAFATAGLKVPYLNDVLAGLKVDKLRAQKIVTLLLRERLLVKVSEELVFHQSALAELRKKIAAQKSSALGNSVAKINVAEFKDMTGVSRKYAIPLLEYLDRERVTRRVGDERVIL